MAAADLIPWKPGQSGNPGGRPKGLAKAVREAYTADDLVSAMVKLAKGEPVAGLKPRMADVTDALKWLADRGWGKAADYKPIEEGDPLELNDVGRAIERVVDDLARKRASKVVGASSNGKVAAADTRA